MPKEVVTKTLPDFVRWWIRAWSMEGESLNMTKRHNALPKVLVLVKGVHIGGLRSRVHGVLGTATGEIRQLRD